MSERDAERNFRTLRARGDAAHAALPVPDPRDGWPDGLAGIYEAQGTPETLAGADHERTRLDFEKWRLLHKFVHQHPFHPDRSLARGDQWRALHAHVEALLGDPEILAWIAEQAEINDNRAKGLHDWRPRKDCACHNLLLEYVANRKRTALAIHHFALAEKDDDLSGEGLGEHCGGS